MESASKTELLDPTARQRVMQPSAFVEIQQSFTSGVSAIAPFVDRLMNFVRPLIHEFTSADEVEGDIEIAVIEAASNAVVHGNRESPEKRVYVNCGCTVDADVLITVRDEGQGFDPRSLTDP